MHNITKSALATGIALALPLLAFAATCYKPYTATGCGTGRINGSFDNTVCRGGSIAWQRDAGRYNTAGPTDSGGRVEMINSQSSCEVIRTYISTCSATPNDSIPGDRSIFTTVPSKAVQGGLCLNPI